MCVVGYFVGGFGDIEFVGEVGEVNLFGTQLFGGGEGFGEVHVGGMFAAVQGVDDKHVDILEQWPGFSGDGFDVRHVGDGGGAGVLESVALGVHIAVNDVQRGDGEFSYLKWAVGFNGVGFNIALVGVCGKEGPAEYTLDFVQTDWGAVKGEGGIAVPAEGA